MNYQIQSQILFQKWYTQIVCSDKDWPLPLVDNYDHVNENNEEQHNGTLVSSGGSLEFEQPHLDNLDPKLLQAAQFFVQDLIERAKIEVTKKLASSERQVCELIRVCVILTKFLYHVKLKFDSKIVVLYIKAGKIQVDHWVYDENSI